jgi:hypothetical protein
VVWWWWWVLVLVWWCGVVVAVVGGAVVLCLCQVVFLHVDLVRRRTASPSTIVLKPPSMLSWKVLTLVSRGPTKTVTSGGCEFGLIFLIHIPSFGCAEACSCAQPHYPNQSSLGGEGPPTDKAFVGIFGCCHQSLSKFLQGALPHCCGATR